MQKLLKPSIHVNGTSVTELMSAYEKAGDALQEAIRCLQDCAPNGRDYYPQGAGALLPAINQHQARVSRLHSVLEELEILYQHCGDELEARQRRRSA